MAQFPANIRFPIRDSSGNPTTTVVDMADMFLRKEQYLTAGLWAWGNNPAGELGIGNISPRSSPVQIGALTTWRTISGEGDHTLAIKTDGTLWAWGNGGSGVLGLNTTANYSSPVQVGALTNWRQAVAGHLISAAIKTDGTLWTWGDNGSGGLGLGNTTSYNSPVQVGPLTNWQQVAVSEWFSAAAVKSDGTLWTWGLNSVGQLGDGTVIDKSSPVQIGTLINWRQVACGYHMAAIKKDGTLWTWGVNGNGQLGLNTTANYISPVQVGSLNNWRQVACGYFHTAAIKTDGTLWTWGRNLDGQLGIGNTINTYSSPVQVGSLTNWKFVAASDISGYTAAIKTDGTLWAWGDNTNGQLGQGNTNPLSSPVQIGSLTNWKTISCGYSVRRITAIQSPDLP